MKTCASEGGKHKEVAVICGGARENGDAGITRRRDVSSRWLAKKWRPLGGGRRGVIGRYPRAARAGNRKLYTSLTSKEAANRSAMPALRRRWPSYASAHHTELGRSAQTPRSSSDENGCRNDACDREGKHREPGSPKHQSKSCELSGHEIRNVTRNRWFRRQAPKGQSRSTSAQQYTSQTRTPQPSVVPQTFIAVCTKGHISITCAEIGCLLIDASALGRGASAGAQNARGG